MPNSKKKGNAGEQLFAKFLREHGIKAWKDSASGAGSGDKGDINNSLDLCIEVKTVKKINLKKAWAQVTHSASLNRNSPLLVIHLDGMSQNEWLIVMPSSDWVEWAKRSSLDAQNSLTRGETPKVVGRAREVVWKLQGAKTAVAQLLKALEELEI